MLLDVLEVVAPVKHFSKLREFVEMKLPPGFPVKIGNLCHRLNLKFILIRMLALYKYVNSVLVALTDIPILPTITTRVSFQEFQFRDDICDSLFQIPKNYSENPGR